MEPIISLLKLSQYKKRRNGLVVGKQRLGLIEDYGGIQVVPDGQNSLQRRGDLSRRTNSDEVNRSSLSSFVSLRHYMLSPVRYKFKYNLPRSPSGKTYALGGKATTKTSEIAKEYLGGDVI